MARKPWSDEEEPCALQMGPMMDCTFLLLLYFVSVSTIDSVRMSKDVQLPAAKAGVKEKDESGRFIVDIEWDDGQQQALYKVGLSAFTDARDLIPLIEKNASVYKANKNFRVIIRCDRRVPYEFTQQVMMAVAEAQVPNMLFSTREKEQGDSGGEAGRGS